MAKHDPATDSTTPSSAGRGATRRDFLHWTAGAGLAAAACGSSEPAAEATEPAAPTFSAPLGVELYTVRNELPDQAEEVLKRLAEIGFVEIEYGWNWVKTGAAAVERRWAAPCQRVHRVGPGHRQLACRLGPRRKP